VPGTIKKCQASFPAWVTDTVLASPVTGGARCGGEKKNEELGVRSEEWGRKLGMKNEGRFPFLISTSSFLISSPCSSVSSKVQV
jgi:hypothetical protein